MASSSSPPPHVVLFPFMAKGHTIPLLHLARLLIHRNAAAVTIFTTPANHPFISDSLSDVQVSIIDLPFPENIPGVPPGIESTDKLPDSSLWITLAKATKLMQPHFEQALRKLTSVTFMVTDGFLWWTVDAAIKYSIPRLVFYGMGNYAPTIVTLCYESEIFKEVENDNELVTVPNFPWIKVSRKETEPGFSKDVDSRDPSIVQFHVDCSISTSKSYGVLMNSFYEFEQAFIDFSRSHHKSKLFCVGPLCLAEPVVPEERAHDNNKPFWIQWLDQKLDQKRPVLYVAFGSQAEISSEQFQEIKNGLEESQVNFLWVERKNGSTEEDGFEERVKDRGLVVKEWVNQREILGHQSVQGFLSHCGWGSVMESVCAKVPILAWPLAVEQPLNAKFVAEEVKIGVMVERCDGSVTGFVKSEGLQKCVNQLMEGETGKMVRKRAKEYGEAAMRAMEEGGSSWNELNELLIELLPG